MIWRHEWGPPSVMTLERGSRVHVAVQDCVRCRTRRNPLNGAIVRKDRSSTCHQVERPVEHDWSSQLRRVAQDLDFLEADGRRVDRAWGADRSRPAELPLAYKD